MPGIMSFVFHYTIPRFAKRRLTTCRILWTMMHTDKGNGPAIGIDAIV